jgi:hypothetical protein
MKPTVVRIVEEFAQGPDGRGQMVIRIDFTVGDHGPFTKRFPKDTYNAAAARRELEDFARDIGMVTG